MSPNSTTTSNTLPAIVISGFMGTGKTTVGKALAEILALDFIDTDEEIEASEGATVAEIFKEKGEKHFRALENKLCKNLAKRRGVVIATGGGTLLDAGNMASLSRVAQLVLLEASIDALVKRLSSDGARPLMDLEPAGSSVRAHVQSMLEKRNDTYHQIELRVDTSDRTPEQTAARIASHLPVPHRSMSVALFSSVEKGKPTSIDGLPLGRFGVSHLHIGRGQLSKLGEHMKQTGLDGHAFLLMPQNLQDLYLDQIEMSLQEESIPFSVLTIKDGDPHKHLKQAGDILDELVKLGAKRDSTIVPVGGGVTGDLGGFVASMYMRGIPFVHVPTTVLAQVDSSIGGKVGVNHPLAKNIIGAFYQPHLIIDDPSTFRSLPTVEISNGLAEVVKSALIGSEALFSYVEEQTSKDAGERLRDITFLEACVTGAAEVKAEIVNGDPLERGDRRFMNLGHTLGHALESVDNYQGLKHGQAVSLGMIAALRIAKKRGRIDPDLVTRARRVLKWCGLPVTFETYNRDDLVRSLQLDKKIKKGKLHFVLPTGLGTADVVDDVSIDDILSTMEEG